MAASKKYRINELLESLPLKKNRQALRILPEQLGIGPATFNNYRAIGVNDPQDIPHTIVAKLEQFFAIKPGELQNFTTDMRPIAEIPEDLEELAGTLGLTKH